MNDCYVCNNTEPTWLSKRCEKHDVCLSCGKSAIEIKEEHWAEKGGWVCASCEEKRIQNEINEFQAKNEDEDDFWSDEKPVICPYCGHHNKVEEGYMYFEEGYHTDTCGNCNNDFELVTYISISYTTRKKEK